MHLLFAGLGVGHALLQQRHMKAPAKATSIEFIDFVTLTPRCEKWKTACTKSDGQMTS